MFELKHAHPTKIEKPWGFEVWHVVVPGKYAFKTIHMNAGESLSLQRHTEKHETQFYLEGHACVEHGADPDAMIRSDMHGTGSFAPAATITFAPGMWHRITAVTDVVFAEVQTAYDGWEHDVTRLSDRYGREGTTAPSVVP